MNEKLLSWLSYKGYNKSFLKEIKKKFSLNDDDLYNYVLITEGLKKRESSVGDTPVLLKNTVKSLFSVINDMVEDNIVDTDENSVGPMHIKVDTNFTPEDKEFFEKILNKTIEDSVDDDNDSKMAALYIVVNNGAKDFDKAYGRYVHGSGAWKGDNKKDIFLSGIQDAKNDYKTYIENTFKKNEKPNIILRNYIIPKDKI